MPGIVDTMWLGVPVAQAKALCVFVHGRNQSPEDMQLAVIRHLSTPDIAYALPRAGDKCWYNALAVNPLTAGARAELALSLAGLATLITSLRDQAPGRPLILAGFSQGACLSLEHAFTGQAAPQALAAFTGCRVGVATDTRAAHLAPGLPVYITAGSDDPWIPLPAFATAVTELGAARCTLRADVFPDRAHEVSRAEIAMLDSMLAAASAGQPLRFEASR